MPASKAQAKKKLRPGNHAPLPAVDRTTLYDTITMEQWHRFRNAERARFLEAKLLEEGAKP